MHPRVVIAGLKGGSGKTLISLGLVSAWRKKGYRVAPFKKGPDFIDAGWLTFAGHRPCYNLDPFLMNQTQILGSFLHRSDGMDISLIEGNRGLYDGLDVNGCCSTAELSKLLKAPVLLIVDVTMSTRTIAAITKGCQVFDPDLDMAGVILNRVANQRQEGLIRTAVEKYCDLPVVGAIPRLRENPFPERHMGLVPHQETERAAKAVSWAEKIVSEHIHLDQIWKIAHGAGPVQAVSGGLLPESIIPPGHASPRIGFLKDRAFWFYYPENLEYLERLGAVLVQIDSISDRALPSLDALYIGGGFPETQAQALADNEGFRESLREAVEEGLPVYAECGGFMYLGKRLLMNNRSYPMVGALPLEFILQKKPQGHGYTVLEVIGQNPYYPLGQLLRGHEFHYSRAVASEDRNREFVFRVNRGHGIDGLRDGLCRKKLLASYTHVHAAGNPAWARSLLRAAVEYGKRE
ncbi:MAG: hydrogenobyrinic acid a,c-diamide synthase (glutamine-hydrolyzing) [Deltaproteobacteria bacterium]|nr:hydrogenobyrinic acid a,c-diamide synthase (glutamine-hydrolyzing) [Deltaproteobacteria bacterium]MBW2047006.1 hydrogenobyrinic acid a,c-diamide synthase (glutamine-hydrolyzing) [Deltaproteobacteria bacterium]MBW2111109.1 hydrogenobyrinic acid a,c-diamide synthase (glutamine-hydrolyzing) [Deltaproteobacteria bacterium]MBW2351684.1 hydrogenobyrinic acid a,c-diamide synthase (glutamine-hydrolyzing) [Deltaproteobacteria bacterium]HDZ91894.1 hydrogenobyrinic acid a,c-diamide synthase (glutamine-